MSIRNVIISTIISSMIMTLTGFTKEVSNSTQNDPSSDDQLISPGYISTAAVVASATETIAGVRFSLQERQEFLLDEMGALNKELGIAESNGNKVPYADVMAIHNKIKVKNKEMSDYKESIEAMNFVNNNKMSLLLTDILMGIEEVPLFGLSFHLLQGSIALGGMPKILGARFPKLSPRLGSSTLGVKVTATAVGGLAYMTQDIDGDISGHNFVKPEAITITSFSGNLAKKDYQTMANHPEAYQANVETEAKAKNKMGRIARAAGGGVKKINVKGLTGEARVGVFNFHFFAPITSYTAIGEVLFVNNPEGQALWEKAKEILFIDFPNIREKVNERGELKKGALFGQYTTVNFSYGTGLNMWNNNIKLGINDAGVLIVGVELVSKEVADNTERDIAIGMTKVSKGATSWLSFDWF